MHEQTRRASITWAQIEAIPQNMPALYVVSNRRRADDCETLIAMRYGGEHNIHVRIVSPDSSGARTLKSVKEAIFLDHTFLEELSDEETEEFQELTGCKKGEQSIS